MTIIDKLVLLAAGDIDLVREAINISASRNRGGDAPLGAVVDYIVSRRQRHD